MPPRCTAGGGRQRVGELPAEAEEGPEPEPAGSPGASAASAVSRAAARAGLEALGLPVDIAGEISVTASTVREVLGLALARLIEDIALEDNVASSDASSDRGTTSTTEWNQFQRRLRGTGLSRVEVARLYREEREAMSQLVESRSSSSSTTPASPGPPAPTTPPLELGYVLVRAPEESAHLRGHHRCGWAQLLRRLGLTHQEWSSRRALFYMPRYSTHSAMESTWRAQGLRLPVPVDPGTQP